MSELCDKFLALAISEIGVKETPGPAATPRINEYAKHTSLKATSDEVAWCSSFANWVVDTAGFKGTGSAAARSWLSWGRAIDSPVPGCIVVLDRHDANNPNAAHVTFYERNDGPGFIICVGGNQGDMVKRSTYKVAGVLGYRVPNE